jgi:hypothetical protein
MDTALALLLLAGAGATTALRSWRQRRARKRARAQLRARPPLDASTPDGSVVRVTGTVRALATLASPLEGTPCVVFRASVDAQVGGLREVVQLTPFVLERDGEPPVLVDGTHALFDLSPARVHVADRLRVEQFLARFGMTVANEIPRLEELVITAGQRISVAGLVMHDIPDAPTTDERGFREHARPQLRIAGNAEHPLAIGRPED